MTDQDKTPRLGRAAIWAAIDERRLAVADMLDSLTGAEWQAPSLCARWTVKDVAAHLTLQDLGVGDMLARLPAMLRSRGNLNRALDIMTKDRAAEAGPARLTELIRASAGSRKVNAGVTHLETLTDILVHGADIAIPLGRALPMAPEPAAVAATRMWTMHWPRPFPIRKTLRRYRLQALDTDWSVGAGPLVEGSMESLLLLNTGRLVALRDLTGPGAAQLTAALQTDR